MAQVGGDCPFCDSEQMAKRGIHEFNYWFVVGDKFPVSKGHTLIVLKRHYPDMFGLGGSEWEELRVIIKHAKMELDEEFNPDGYNLGVNCGEAAGQTVFHLYVHLIPRYNGDVENPRGGIRNFKKPLVGCPIPEELNGC